MQLAAYLGGMDQNMLRHGHVAVPIVDTPVGLFQETLPAVSWFHVPWSALPSMAETSAEVISQIMSFLP